MVEGAAVGLKVQDAGAGGLMTEDFRSDVMPPSLTADLLHSHPNMLKRSRFRRYLYLQNPSAKNALRPVPSPALLSPLLVLTSPCYSLGMYDGPPISPPSLHPPQIVHQAETLRC